LALSLSNSAQGIPAYRQRYNGVLFNACNSIKAAFSLHDRVGIVLAGILGTCAW
jgi:hypothetical protein